MPPVVAAAAIGAGASLGGGVLASRSASSAAKQQAQAANQAAQYQSQSTREALDFQKQQAALEMQRSEADRRANYDQWLAREQRLGSLGQMVGLGARNIPGYVPSMQTTSGMPSAPGGPTPTGAQPNVSAANGAIQPQLEAFFQSRGVPTTEVPYWASKWNELEARGKEIGNPNYANMRLGMADILGGARYGGAPSATVGSIGQMASASPMGAPTAPLTAPIQVQSTAYRPPSRLRDYLRS